MTGRASLTDRELQVLRGISEGMTNAEIGRRLYLSEDTVKTHVRRLFNKLGARDRAHAVTLAFQLGLVAAAKTSGTHAPGQTPKPATTPGPDEYTRPMREDAQVANVAVHRLRAHPQNVRTDLGDLRDLIDSIRHEGVLVPLMAEKRGDTLQILHGHRRWAAAQLAGVPRVPVVIVPPHADHEAIFLMLAEDKKETISRADRRRAVVTLRETHGRTWTEIAERLGYAVSTVRAWASDDGTGDDQPPAPSGGDQRPARPKGAPARYAAAALPRRQPPRVTPRRLHELLTRVDDGHLDAEAAVQELRGWLGDWEPAVHPQPAARVS